MVETAYQEKKLTMTEDLLYKLTEELGRQTVAVDNLERDLSDVCSTAGPLPIANDDTVKEITNNSKLVVKLREILVSLERNTNRINATRDRLEV